MSGCRGEALCRNGSTPAIRLELGSAARNLPSCATSLASAIAQAAYSFGYPACRRGRFTPQLDWLGGAHRLLDGWSTI